MIDAEAAHALLLEEQPSGSSVETFLPEHNRGYRLLCKMGWAGQGVGLGRRGGGIAVPVRLTEQYGSLGLGKATEYNEKAEAATETRRAMTSELIASEDADGKAAREAAEARKQGIADAVHNQNAAFYCEICDKQYTKIMEFENHLSSYDHHHRKRFKEMQQEQKARNRERQQSLDKGKPKKERKDPAMLAAEAAAAAAAAASASSSIGAVDQPPPPPPPNPPGDNGSSSSSSAAAANPSVPSAPSGAPPPPPPASSAPLKFGGMSFGGGSKAGGGGGMKLGGGVKRKLPGKPSGGSSLFAQPDDDD